MLRNVPDNSTVVGVPGHIIFREGKRVVITDPKQINDPLSEALAAVAAEVSKFARTRPAIGRRRHPQRAASRVTPAHHGRSRLPDLDVKGRAKWFPIFSAPSAQSSAFSAVKLFLPQSSPRRAADERANKIPG